MTPPDPLSRFTEWLDTAKADARIAEPTAMCLATATPSGKPSARMVLLKAHDARGFVFYTNEQSRKGGELIANPYAALCFHWMPLERQIRIEGEIERVSEAEADSYFASRARDSQIGAWASDQSRPLEAREKFLRRMEEVAARFEGKPIPRPPYWGGFRVLPERIEFWQQVEFRLHLREVYTRAGEGWNIAQLYP